MERISIKNDGKVGIGSSAPKGDLQVNGHLIFDRTSGSKDYMIGNNIYNDGGWKYIDNGFGSILTFSNSGTIGMSTFPSGTAGATASISNKFYMNNNGNIGLSNTDPSSMLDINASLGYNQLRLRTKYTPTNTSDSNGKVGDTAWDDDYFYIKTSSGWKRVALSTF